MGNQLSGQKRKNCTFCGQPHVLSGGKTNECIPCRNMHADTLLEIDQTTIERYANALNERQKLVLISMTSMPPLQTITHTPADISSRYVGVEKPLGSSFVSAPLKKLMGYGLVTKMEASDRNRYFVTKKGRLVHAYVKQEYFPEARGSNA